MHLKTDRADEHHRIDDLSHPFEKNEKALVMMIITNGSPSSEGHEVRLRDRNAVLSALGVACFVPKEQEHIHYFKWPPARTNYLKFVPYEWLEHRKLRQCNNGKLDTYERVLVLWFQEDDLGPHPLKTLSDVWEQVSRKETKKAESLLFIIGPRSSSGLRTMVEGLLKEHKTKSDGSSSLFKGVSLVNLWSPWATVDDDLLLYSLRNVAKDKWGNKINDCILDGENAFQGERQNLSGRCVRAIFLEKKVLFLEPFLQIKS